MNTKALAAISEILSRLGRQFARWLVKQGLSEFKAKLSRSIKRIRRKARKAKRRGRVALAKFRAWRVEWRVKLLAWANEYHAEITEKVAKSIYEAAEKVPHVGDTLERWEKDPHGAW